MYVISVSAFSDMNTDIENGALTYINILLFDKISRKFIDM